MAKPDGGAAFPTDVEQNGLLDRHQGMTLRDYFAAAALQGLITHFGSAAENLASDAYGLADAMLAERSK